MVIWLVCLSAGDQQPQKCCLSVRQIAQSAEQPACGVGGTTTVARIGHTNTGGSRSRVQAPAWSLFVAVLLVSVLFFVFSSQIILLAITISVIIMHYGYIKQTHQPNAWISPVAYAHGHVGLHETTLVIIFTLRIAPHSENRLQKPYWPLQDRYNFG